MSGEKPKSRWSLWRKRKRNVEEHMQSVTRSALASDTSNRHNTCCSVDPSIISNETPDSACAVLVHEESLSVDSSTEADPVGIPEHVDQLDGVPGEDELPGADRPEIDAENAHNSDGSSEFDEQYDDFDCYSPSDQMVPRLTPVTVRMNLRRIPGLLKI
jgi:hypothetical protein